MNRNYDNLWIRFIYIFYIPIDKNYNSASSLAGGCTVYIEQRCLISNHLKNEYFLMQRLLQRKFVL
jgi:hypothetical protein